MLAVVFALSAVIVAPASAKLSKSQKVHIRHQLRKQIKKNPKLIRSKRFIKRAALVNFKLPVTIRLRTGDVPATPANEAATNNTNSANLDLGASLGQRQVNLGGSLAAEITFADSFDGGALGNVKLDILPSSTRSLSSTSIPLLWNTQVSDPTTHYEANLIGLPSALSGCGNFTGSANLPFGAGFIDSPLVPGADTLGLPGVPFDAIGSVGGAPEGFLPVDPGVDNINDLTAGKDPGNPDSLGGNPSPFPSGSAPGGFSQPPSVKDTVLRTAPLSLSIAAPGTNVNQTGQPGLGGNPDGVSGGSNITIGKSGGEANLFGKIPGKNYGIDVTVSLATKINSIFRIVDQDAFGSPLVEGTDWPAGIFNCRQVYSGAIQNYIPGVRLVGNLRISPGITSDGHLRIAKATIASPATGEAGDVARFAVAACLAPFASFNQPQNSSDTYPNPSKVPTPAGFPGTQPTASLPSDVDSFRNGAALATVQNAACNAPATGLVRQSALSPAEVGVLAPAAPADGYTVTNSGSAVSVAADLKVTNVSVDVLIGDTP
jgi:hypothetical protein